LVVTQKAVDSKAMHDKISVVLKKLNIDYNNTSLYVLAFIHRSIVNERPDFAPEHNERLEFLGDAVLELAITKNLYNDFPKKPEGELTDIRSALVR
jgi:ribonuclease-3